MPNISFKKAREILDNCSADDLWQLIESKRLTSCGNKKPPEFEESDVRNLAEDIRLKKRAPKVHPKTHGTARAT